MEGHAAFMLSTIHSGALMGIEAWPITAWFGNGNCLAKMYSLIVIQGMSTSFTIRLPERQREALRKRAKAMQSSESAWVRHIIEKDLENSTLQEQLADLVGSLDSSKGTKKRANSLKEAIRQRNWRA